jgi:hypothetical protein
MLSKIFLTFCCMLIAIEAQHSLRCDTVHEVACANNDSG